MKTLSKFWYVCSLAFIFFIVGFLVSDQEIFPYNVITDAKTGYKYLKAIILGREDDFYIRPTSRSKRVTKNFSGQQEGLTMLSCIGKQRVPEIRIVDNEGMVVHSWLVDWFQIWPDAQHLENSEIPKRRPGTHVHGMVLLQDGSIVFNYEHLGLVRLSKGGEVLWKLDYRTHHSVNLDEDGFLWVCGQINHYSHSDRIPNHLPPYIEPTILKVNLDGEIIQELSVIDILRQNGLNGLLHLSSIQNTSTEVTGNTLHLNDVEVFPSGIKEDLFSKGDLLVSLRNINTVMVIEPSSLKVKLKLTGNFLRQHDPDFISGNRVSIFDNNNLGYMSGEGSRILIISFNDLGQEVYYGTDSDQFFYTDIMGSHQWLENGNLLITESMNGRVFEINSEKEVIWEYNNLIDNGKIGIVEDAFRLPSSLDKAFFQSK